MAAALIGTVGLAASAVRTIERSAPPPAAAAAPVDRAIGTSSGAGAPTGTGSAGTGSAGTGSGSAGTGSAGTSSAGTGSAGTGSAGTSSAGTGSAGTGGSVRPSGELERGESRPIGVPVHGPATYRRAHLDLPAPSGHGRVIRFDVRVERGLELDPDGVARLLQHTLADRRSWRSTDRVRFQLVADPAKSRLHAYLVSPGTTDRLCYPWLTRGAVSCQNGDRVVLNARRWVRGAKAYGTNLAGYREYLVNHEFGHALGYRHVRCPGPGRPAPVMMQQTKGLHGCRPNPWPAVARR